ELFDVRVRSRRLVRLDDLDLPLAEQPPVGVDLLSGEEVAFVRRLAEHRRGTGEERHVADLEGFVRDTPLGLRDGLRDWKPGQAPRRGAGRHPHADAKSTQKIPASDRLSHVLLLVWPSWTAPPTRRVYAPWRHGRLLQQRPRANPATEPEGVRLWEAAVASPPRTKGGHTETPTQRDAVTTLNLRGGRPRPCARH